MNGLLEQAWQFVTDKLSAILGPFLEWLMLAEVWAAVGLFLAVCIVLATFLPFKWPKVILGWLASLAIAFASGVTWMYRRIPKSKPKPQPPQRREWWQ